MLNEKGQRELVYVVKVDDVRPIPGRDRVECAVVNGWTVMTRLGQFEPGDLGIYFEIDSRVPAEEPFLFLEKRHYKIKTQKFKTPEGQFWSQGLLMSFDDFGWEKDKYALGDFLTKELKVVYADADDNKRKAPSADKYKKMAQRHPKIFKQKWAQWMMRRNWGKKVMFLFFGKKKDKRGGWPAWVVKTDEERVQNIPWILKDDTQWIATEKIDGTSTTFTMKRGKFGKKEFYVCSRNVCFSKERGDKCFYNENYYTKMAKKYNIERVLSDLLDKNPGCPWITIQGETYGAGVQKRDYSMKNYQNFMAFNLIFGDERGRVSSVEMQTCLAQYNILSVPIVKYDFQMPETVEELLDICGGPSIIDGGMREGLVFRSIDGKKSFKAVDNNFLDKYHR